MTELCYKKVIDIPGLFDFLKDYHLTTQKS